MEEITIDRIIRSKRKTLALIVAPDATLTVRAPFETTLEYIGKIVFTKRFWITEKKQQASKVGGEVQKKEFVHGEGFLYLGETYRMRIQDGQDVILEDGEMLFPKKYREHARKYMMLWYKKRALEKIKERVDWYSKSTGWYPTSIKVNSAQTRWGSCGSQGALNFTWRLIMAPLAVIDYVVVHELAHIHERNHSSKFWNKVKTVLPDYKEREKWLKENRKHLFV